MKPMFFVRLVMMNTFKKRLRALLVIGGIAITSSAMIVLFGVSIGLHELVNDALRESDGLDVVTVDQRNVQQIKLDEERVSRVRSVSGVGQVESSVGLVGNLVYHGIDLSMPVYGVTPGYFGVSPATFKSRNGNELQGSNIVVSTKVLEAFEMSEKGAVGRTLTAKITVPKNYSSKQAEQSVVTEEETYTISGVIDKGDAPVAYLPLERMRENGVDSVSQLKVRVTVPGKMLEVRESIEQMGLQTSSVQDTVDQINKVFSVIEKTLVVFGFIVTGITVSGTFTVISLTLMEEMPQIGFLRVSGLKNRDVKVMFIAQSIVLTTLGALAGVIGGIIAGGVVNRLADVAAAGEVFTGRISVFAVPTVQISLVLILSMAVGWAVGVFPAKRAVLLQPLDELKL